jgi:hypothetical protein
MHIIGGSGTSESKDFLQHEGQGSMALDTVITESGIRRHLLCHRAIVGPSYLNNESLLAYTTMQCTATTE